MANPEESDESRPLTQSIAAPQREGWGGAASGAARPRGPHPLPVFLGLVARHCSDDCDRLARVLTEAR